jgi:hypothetical protein
VVQIEPGVGDFPTRSVATLELRETWKGDAGEGPVHVSFDPASRCPMPAHYELDTRVLAFLSRRDGRLHTVGRSYGVKVVTWEQIDESRSAVSSLQAVLAQPVAGVREAKLTEWIVRRVERPSTRIDGLIDLSRNAFAEPPSWAPLDVAQQRRLLAILADDPEQRGVWLFMRVLLNCARTPELDALADEYLLASIDDQPGREPLRDIAERFVGAWSPAG